MKKILLTVLSVICVIGVLCAVTACKEDDKGTTYADGTYTGRSKDYQADESGVGAGYGTVELTIQDGKIAACTFSMYELDGTLKDSSYGSDLSDDNRRKAQKAVQSAPRYAKMLVESGSLDGVDAISGATISYNEFVEAVNDALSKAKVAEE